MYLDLHEADGVAQNCAGPLLGCSAGCLCFWLGCRGCRALYCAKAADENTLEIHKGSDDGLLQVVHVNIPGVKNVGRGK